MRYIGDKELDEFLSFSEVTKTDKIPDLLRRLKKNAAKREITDANGKVILKKIEDDESCSDSEILTKDITLEEASKFRPSVKTSSLKVLETESGYDVKDRDETFLL